MHNAAAHSSSINQSKATHSIGCRTEPIIATFQSIPSRHLHPQNCARQSPETQPHEGCPIAAHAANSKFKTRGVGLRIVNFLQFQRSDVEYRAWGKTPKINLDPQWPTFIFYGTQSGGGLNRESYMLSGCNVLKCEV